MSTDILLTATRLMILYDMPAPAAPCKPSADSRLKPLAEQPSAADNCIPSVMSVQDVVIHAQDRLRRLSPSDDYEFEQAVSVVLPQEDDVDIDVVGLVDPPDELGAGCATDAAVKHNCIGQVQAGKGYHWLCMLLPGCRCHSSHTVLCSCIKTLLTY